MSKELDDDIKTIAINMIKQGLELIILLKLLV